MYRNEISPKVLENPNLIDKFILIILPNYFYEYKNVLDHLIREKFGIIEKCVKNFKSTIDVMEWKSAQIESQDIWGLAEKLTQGPSMILLCQRANAFLAMQEFANYHNNISQKMSGIDGIYFSPTTLAAYQDIQFFFPTHINEKDLLKHAKDYLQVEVWPTLSQCLARVAVERPKNPIEWLAKNLHDSSR